MPFIILPAKLSRRPRLSAGLGFVMEMGLGPALTKESWRLRLKAESKVGPVVMSRSPSMSKLTNCLMSFEVVR